MPPKKNNDTTDSVRKLRKHTDEKSSNVKNGEKTVKVLKTNEDLESGQNSKSDRQHKTKSSNVNKRKSSIKYGNKDKRDLENVSDDEILKRAETIKKYRNQEAKQHESTCGKKVECQQPLSIIPDGTNRVDFTLPLTHHSLNVPTYYSTPADQILQSSTRPTSYTYLNRTQLNPHTLTSSELFLPPQEPYFYSQDLNINQKYHHLSHTNPIKQIEFSSPQLPYSTFSPYSSTQQLDYETNEKLKDRIKKYHINNVNLKKEVDEKDMEIKFLKKKIADSESDNKQKILELNLENQILKNKISSLQTDLTNNYQWHEPWCTRTCDCSHYNYHYYN